MARHNSQPLSWLAVGLAILPGIFVFATAWHNGMADLLSVTGMAVLLLIAGIGILYEGRVPVWSYATWGLLVGQLLLVAQTRWLILAYLGLVLVAWGYAGRLLVQRRKDGNLPNRVSLLLLLFGILSLLLPALIMLVPGFLSLGLLALIAWPVTIWLALAWIPFVIRSGIHAFLFVLGFGLVLWKEGIDFDYFIHRSSWDTLMTAIWALLLLIFAPICLLRFRSQTRKIGSVLLLVALAFGSVIVLSAIARHQPSLLTNPPVNLYAWVLGLNQVVNGVGLLEPSTLLPAIWRPFPSVLLQLLELWLILLLYAWLGQNSQQAVRAESVQGHLLRALVQKWRPREAS